MVDRNESSPAVVLKSLYTKLDSLDLKAQATALQRMPGTVEAAQWTHRLLRYIVVRLARKSNAV